MWDGKGKHIYMRYVLLRSEHRGLPIEWVFVSYMKRREGEHYIWYIRGRYYMWCMLI